MEWKKLTKASLKDLRNENKYFIVLSSPGYVGGFPYDIINWLDLKDLGLMDDEMTHCWNNLGSHNAKYEYDDDELLIFFSHYCVIEEFQIKK